MVQVHKYKKYIPSNKTIFKVHTNELSSTFGYKYDHTKYNKIYNNLSTIIKDKRKLNRYLKKGYLTFTYVPFYFLIPKDINLPIFETNTKEVVAQMCNIKTCLEEIRDLNIKKYKGIRIE